MQGYNHTTLAGNLTRDPELTYTPRGKAVCKISLAINSTYTNEAGEKCEDVSFIDCVAWGVTAENIGQYMRKGRPILIDGRLKQETWDDKQTGNKRSRVVVTVQRAIFLGSAQDGEQGEQGGERRPARPAGRTRQQQNDADPLNQSGGPPESDDVPF